jgi:hypothetical protein
MYERVQQNALTGGFLVLLILRILYIIMYVCTCVLSAICVGPVWVIIKEVKDTRDVLDLCISSLGQWSSCSYQT